MVRKYFRKYFRTFESTKVLSYESTSVDPYCTYESTFESRATFVLSYKIYQKIDMIPLCTCTLYESRTFESTRTRSVLSKVSFTFVLSKYFRTKIYFRTFVWK